MGLARAIRSRMEAFGNKFLALPELAPGSADQRSPATDRTACVGILFYLVTGQDPRVLLDSEGLAPHQRTKALEVLKSLPERQYAQLLRIFDTEFRPRMAHRWPDTDSLLAAVRVLHGKEPQNYSERLDALKEEHERSSGHVTRVASKRLILELVPSVRQCIAEAETKFEDHVEVLLDDLVAAPDEAVPRLRANLCFSDVEKLRSPLWASIILEARQQALEVAFWLADVRQSVDRVLILHPDAKHEALRLIEEMVLHCLRQVLDGVGRPEEEEEEKDDDDQSAAHAKSDED